MKTCHGLLLILLALLSRVSAERPQTVVATIPSEVLLQNVANDGGEVPLAVEGGLNRPTKDFEVTGFITKNGDIFELPSPRSMGSIEAREEPELETGMKMCRYGNIVVYSDSDCNSFFSPSELSGGPLKSQIQNESEEDDDVRKPAKKRNKVKGNKRKPNKNRNKNKKRLNKNRRKQQQRKKALKKQQNQRRRRNKLKNGGKRGNPQRKNNRRVNKNRNGNKVNKRRRINDSEGEGRSDVEVAPLQFTILLNRH